MAHLMPVKWIVFALLAQCALTAAAEELPTPWWLELPTPWWSAAPPVEVEALSDAERYETLRRSIIAILSDPASADAWETFSSMERFIPRNRAAVSESDALSRLDAVLTCGPPVDWPRFAVIACASTYVRFAEDLARAGMSENAVRYRRVAAMILIEHGATALAQKAPGCAERFLSLSDAYWTRVRKNDFQAVEAYERLGRLDALSELDLSHLGSIVSEAAINVSWDPETRILRTPDADDFFDLAEHPHEDTGRIPYGMTSPDEDGATLVTMLVMDEINKTRVAAEMIEARLAAGNLELPVKVALHEAEMLLGKRTEDDAYFLGQLRSMNARIAQAMQNVENDIAEPTLIGFEIAKAIERIATRLMSDD